MIWELKNGQGTASTVNSEHKVGEISYWMINYRNVEEDTTINPTLTLTSVTRLDIVDNEYEEPSGENPKSFLKS